jgi:hypothetical protein
MTIIGCKAVPPPKCTVFGTVLQSWEIIRRASVLVQVARQMPTGNQTKTRTSNSHTDKSHEARPIFPGISFFLTPAAIADPTIAAVARILS